MPPKIKNKSKKKRSSKQSSQPDRSLAEVTRLLKNLNAPKSQVTDLGRMLLSGGNAVGSMFGFPKVFGSGSYQFTNSLWNASAQVPIVHSSNEGIRFKHREYIGDIAMNGPTFTSYSYSINPGLSTTFPFLSTIANAFQEYDFKGLVFEFKTTSATALASGTNTAMGSVMLACQYRADSEPFVNKMQLLNEMWSVDTVPSSNCVLPIECAPMENVLPRQYVRTGGVGTGDIKMYDLGLVTLATAGGQTGQTNVVGELWVSYDVEFYKPTATPTADGIDQAIYFAHSTTYTQAGVLIGMAPDSQNTMQYVSVSGSSSILFTNLTPPGIYVISLIWYNTNGTTQTGVTIPAITFFNGARYANSTNNSDSNSTLLAPSPGATSGAVSLTIYVYIPATGAGITYGAAAIPNTSGNCIALLTIQPFPSGSVFA